MDEQDALKRVKEELSRAWFAAPDRIAELKIRSVFVERSIEVIEEPLQKEPTSPSQPFDAWSFDWPPNSEKNIASTKIDVRSTYEVQGCAGCSQAGETQCGVCRGSGKVADPKTNRPLQCNTCRGKGTVVCKRCAGYRRLLRFQRIVQRVKTTSTKIRLPDGTKIPTGAASGEAHYSERTPGNSVDAAGAALHGAAPRLNQLGWLPTLAQRFATHESPNGMSDARTGWRTIDGRWYEGWKLNCTTRGKPVEYFVPDTGANIVGPKVRSPKKLGAATGAITVLLVGLGVAGYMHNKAAVEEREAQAQHEAQDRAAKDQQAAKDLADRQATERKEAEQKERLRKQAAITKVKVAATKLAGLTNAKPEDRAAAYDDLNAAGSEAVGEAEIAAILDAKQAADKPWARLRDLNRLDTSPPDLPHVDDKPIYEKPKYEGSFLIAGTYRGPMDLYRGSVLEAGNKFYVIAGGVTEASEGTSMKAYVSNEGHGAVTLNIGRDGREAQILAQKDRETYNDDQKAYAEEVKEAQAAFKEELATYSAAVKARRDAEVKFAKDKQAREAERRQLKPQLDAEILKLLPALLAAAEAPSGPVRPPASP